MTISLIAGSLLSLRKSFTVGERLEEARKAGQIKDAIDAVIFVEKQHAFPLWNLLKPFVVVLGGLLLLASVAAFMAKYYPIYNYCWGEYADEFKKKESARSFWLVIVGVGLVLSFVGSLLAGKIHW